MDIDEEDLFDVFDAPAALAAAAEAEEEAAAASAGQKRRRAGQDGAATGKRARKAEEEEAAAEEEEAEEESSEAADATEAKAKKTQKKKKEQSATAQMSSLGTAPKKKKDRFGAYRDQHVVQTRSLEKDGCLAVRCFQPGVSKAEADELVAQSPAGAPGAAEPAKQYPFKLDPFQREAVNCLERNQSVLVSAHTSAGKTVVAEYAIAMALRDGQRVIYTSPIKALSNQKYREMQEEFEDVGLMTGDVTINPSASCLVMTTEILRNMLYRGSEVMREVAWVVFDEIHYMRDKDRGVVWEETLVLLPHKVRFVFLSATIPNATEFALWVAKLHEQPCEVVYTDYRPTPLEHFVYPSGGSGLHLVLDKKGNFRENNFQKAIGEMNAAAEAEAEEDSRAARKAAAAGSKKKRKPRNKKVSPNDIYKVVKTIMEKKYYPLIVFSFSKRDCEAHALALSKLDFNDETEKELVGKIFANAIDSLSEDDRRLPQVESILPLLRRGIGIHHGGLLPILKEVIEILFQEGLLKCLFATETFAMGLNMPAKTVIFTASRKFDGTNFRVLGGGEYIQMSGRAGRRGLDDRGIVILMLDDKIEPPVAKNMVKGQADPLNSTFHLGYNMVLNLLRVEEADPEYVMQRSFFQFQSTREAPKLRAELAEAETEAKEAAAAVPQPELAASYHRLATKVAQHREALRGYFTQPVYCLQFLNPGRLVRVRSGEGETAADWGWGALVGYAKGGQAPQAALRGPGDSPQKDPKHVYVLEVLVQCEPRAADAPEDAPPVPVPASRADLWKGAARKVPVMLSAVREFSTVRLQVPKNPGSERGQATFVRTMRQVVQRMPKGVPLLDPVEDMRINDEGCRRVVARLQKDHGRLAGHELNKREDREEVLAAHERRLQLDGRCTALRARIRESEREIVLLETLHRMKRVLRRLGFVTDEDVCVLKGMVACEISTCDELLATELMFMGVFNSLKPEQVVALCSVLVFTERAKEDDSAQLREELAAPFRQLVAAARRVAEVKRDAQLEIDVEEYVGQFKPQMMEIVYEWCKGAKFSEICAMTDVFEGTIIRCMRRLEEFLRQMGAAAKTIGNTELEEKFNQGIECMKRDIVFAASLYL